MEHPYFAGLVGWKELLQINSVPCPYEFHSLNIQHRWVQGINRTRTTAAWFDHLRATTHRKFDCVSSLCRTNVYSHSCRIFRGAVLQSLPTMMPAARLFMYVRALLHSNACQSSVVFCAKFVGTRSCATQLFLFPLITCVRTLYFSAHDGIGNREPSSKPGCATECEIDE